MFIQEDIDLEEILQAYKLYSKTHHNKMHMRIDKGMFALKEAGALAYDELLQHLGQYECHLTKHIPGLWKHNTSRMIFTLVVDDFGGKYLSKESTIHLINYLQDKYEELDINWNGNKLCGMTLD